MLNPEMTRVLAEARIAELHNQAESRRQYRRLSSGAALAGAEPRRRVRTSMSRNLRATITWVFSAGPEQAADLKVGSVSR
jgi:hypothetical protein